MERDRSACTRQDGNNLSILFTCRQLGAEYDLKRKVIKNWAFRSAFLVQVSLRAEVVVQEVLKLVEGKTFKAFTLGKETLPSGTNGFELGVTVLARTTGERLRLHAVETKILGSGCRLNRRAKQGERIKNCIVLEPNVWCVGLHEVNEQQWPGGFIPLQHRVHALSHIPLKMHEAVRWFAVPLAPRSAFGQYLGRPRRRINEKEVCSSV